MPGEPARPAADPVDAAALALDPAAYPVGRVGLHAGHHLEDPRKHVGREARLVGELVRVFAFVPFRFIKLAGGVGARGHELPARAALLEAAVDDQVGLKGGLGQAKPRSGKREHECSGIKD